MRQIIVRSQDVEWKKHANCRGCDPDLFYPEKGGNAPRKICLVCVVREQCLEAGLEEHYGIWGGTNERERRKIRKQRLLARGG